MIEKTTLYDSSHKMRSLISDNSLLLMVLGRFGISLGFGDRTVKQVCEQSNVDVATFLSVANFISGKGRDYTSLSLTSLIDYLKHAHSYFLSYNLPTIRRRLIEALDCSGTDDSAFLIIKFYDEYVSEVRKHMNYENDIVFTYVEDLIKGTVNSSYSIRIFAEKHNHIGEILMQLKDIIIGYYPEKDNDMLNSVLFDIINCEQDLTTHCQVEDALFVPAVELMEKSIDASESCYVSDIQEDVSNEEKFNLLSMREKDIIVCVAKGMSNKEIADTLNLSVHTVTTHRRNLSNKLKIHSTAGLTIYAIVNRLVDLQDIWRE